MTDDRIQALVNGVLDRVHGQLRQELTGLADGLRAHIADGRVAAAQAARAEAESAAAALASDAIAAERVVLERRLADARAQARELALAEASGEERAADLARAERLLASVRALDAAGSLSEALDALAQAAQREAGRAAVLLLRGDQLRGWSHAGFGDRFADARTVTVPLADAGLLAAAVAAAAPVATSRADGSAGVLAPAPYTVDGPDRLGVAAPVLVDGRVVAVVYADDGGETDREVPSAWPEHVELLARHASRCLEALTARQSVRARATAGSPGPVQDDESARRYARLLVSEIKLYHEATVDEGRRLRDLRSRLGSQIARARSLYEERVPPGVRTRADFFEQELVRTLADGDAALLGQAS